MTEKNESNPKKQNKILKYFLSNALTIILIIILIYMQVNNLYVKTIEVPTYVETCNGETTGYAEYVEQNTIGGGGKYVGGNIEGTEREWMLTLPEQNETT